MNFFNPFKKEEIKPTSKNVLVALDGSKNALNAFRWYITNSPEVKSDRIILFHTLSPPSNISITDEGDLDFDITDIEKEIQEVQKEAVKMESFFMKECQKNQLSCQWVNQWGKPSNTILKAVDKFQANLVVMGSRGLGAISRTILGSVSNYILHHVHVPLLIVPLQHHN